MFDNDKRFLCIDIPISFNNGNRGQSKHWGSHQDARKKAASALRSATFMAKTEDGAWHEVMPSECHIDQRVDVWATRVLGPGDRSWDPDSILRGVGAKALIDAIVDAQVLSGDSSKHVRYCLGDQCSNMRNIGPKWILEFFKIK